MVMQHQPILREFYPGSDHALIAAVVTPEDVMLAFEDDNGKPLITKDQAVQLLVEHRNKLVDAFLDQWYDIVHNTLKPYVEALTGNDDEN